MNNPRYYSVRQIARTYDLSENGVRKMIREGRLPAVRIGRAVRVSEVDLASLNR